MNSTPSNPAYLFRLQVAGAPDKDVRFRTLRANFRTALASAMIHLRAEPGSSRLLLGIAIEIGPRVIWLTRVDRQRQSEPLPEVLRWESVSDLFDALVRMHKDAMAHTTRQRRGVASSAPAGIA